MNSKEFTFTWKIENFSSCYQQNGECLVSPLFIAENIGNSQWCLILYPRGKSFETNNCVICALCRKDNENACKILVEFLLSIEKITGETFCTFPFSYEFTGALSFGETLIKTEQLFKELRNSTNDTLVITCRMTTVKTCFKKAVACVSKTTFGVIRSSYLWKVRNNFHISGWNSTKSFEIPELCFIGVRLSCPLDEVLIRIFVEKSKQTIPKFVTCRFAIMDASGNKIFSQSGSHLFVSHEILNFDPFFTKSDLDSKTINFLKNGTFSLTCYFSCSNGTNSNEIEYKYDFPTNSSFQLECSSSLHNDMRNMLNQGEHQDTELELEERFFPVHKAILFIRAPKFYAAVENQMIKARINSARLVGEFLPETMTAFLNFVYTDSIPDLKYHIAIDLLIKADRYKMPDLKAKCSSFLGSILSVKNVCEVLQTSNLVKDNNLRSLSVNFIKAKASEVLLSTQWSKFIENNLNLGNEILCQLVTMFGNMAKTNVITHRNKLNSNSFPRIV